MVLKSSWERETCSFIHPDIQNLSGCRDLSFRTKKFKNVVDYLIDKNGNTSYSNELEEQISSSADLPGQGMLPGQQDSENSRDVYFADAGNLIIDKEKASIGMLQRMFKIGFNRAARIMDQLCEAGVVGPEEGTKPRKVLMTKEEFAEYMQNQTS